MELQEIAQIFDCPHSTAPDEGEGYALIRTPNVGKGRLLLDGVHRISEEAYLKRNKRATPKEGDIIFAREAPAGNAAVITKGQKVCLGQRTVLIRPNSDITDSIYLTYYILSPEQQTKLLGLTHGSTVGHVNIPDLARLKCKLPSLNIQRKIASILSTYDNLIENNTKRIKLLEQMAENLYKEWFVRFRFPGYKNVQMENGLPKGWKIERLDNLVEVCYGKDHKKVGDGNIPIYGSGGVMRYGNKFLWDGETVLIPRKGSLNNVMYHNGKIWTVDTMFYTKMLIPDFVKYFYFTIVKIDLASFNSGAALPSMTTDILYHFKFIVPDDDILKKFDDKVSLIYKQIKNIQEMNEHLTKQRDLLLPRLMSGKLEVNIENCGK